MNQEGFNPARRGTATLEAPTLRVVTFPAAAPARGPAGYREIVAGLAADVADVPSAALAALTPALPALRAALVDARWLVGEDQEALFEALAALGRTLDLITDGVTVPPARLGGDMASVVRTIHAIPASRSIAVNYALRHLVGVIAAASGKLLAAGRVASAAVTVEPAPPAAVAIEANEAAEALADRRYADLLISGALFFGGFLVATMLLIDVPEAAVAAGVISLATVTAWFLRAGR